MHQRTDHTQHDETLIAGHAAGDLVGPQLLLANRLLAACEACATLHADLRAIAAATRALPAPALPARDFTLGAERAERLRRGGLARRLLRPFAGPASGARPLAAAFSTLGAVGLAVVLLLPAFGGPAAVPALEYGTFRAAAGPAAGPTAAPDSAPVPGGAAGAPTGSSGGEGYVDDLGGAGPRDQGSNDGTDKVLAEDASVSPATLLLIGSAALLAMGLGLFAVRLIARRVS